MKRLERSIPPWKKYWHGLIRLPQIGRCARLFKNWLRLTQVYGGGPMTDEFVAQGRSDFTIPLRDPTDVQTVWVVFCTGDYYVPRDFETVLDLGANIGAFSLYATRCRNARRIYAFEPVAETFAVLEENLQMNGVTNVRMIRKGIGGKSGSRTIYLGVTSQHASIIYRGAPQFESGATEQVEIVTLEQLFDELQLREVDMAKLDCEGGEVEAIMAASDQSLRRIKQLSLEYHFPGDISTEKEFFNRLKQAGFHCARKSQIGQLAQFVRK
jgi:FkbM family methyltransferase